MGQYNTVVDQAIAAFDKIEADLKASKITETQALLAGLRHVALELAAMHLDQQVKDANSD